VAEDEREGDRAVALWLVRCGKHGEGELTALGDHVVGIGWPEAGDMTGLSSPEKVKAHLTAAYPDAKTSTVANWAGQVNAFLARIAVGDIVAVPLKSAASIAFGRVTGEATYRPDGPESMKHQRPVAWINESLPRSAVDQDLLYSLGAFMTVCRITRNDAEARIRQLLQLDGGGGNATTALPPTEAASEPESTGAVDIGELSRDQIRKRISDRFHGHAMARLVGALLAADGYVAEVSPAGPDGGVDVLAGQGEMGFEGTRIVAQVKSGSVVSDASTLRELQGVMPNFGATHGLLVSWGGFTSVARSEARRLFFKIRLWDSNDVIAQIERTYDRLPSEIQADLPLTRIWTLAEEE
jgi:restriction system protein